MNLKGSKLNFMGFNFQLFRSLFAPFKVQFCTLKGLFLHPQRFNFAPFRVYFCTLTGSISHPQRFIFAPFTHWLCTLQGSILHPPHIKIGTLRDSNFKYHANIHAVYIQYTLKRTKIFEYIIWARVLLFISEKDSHK